MSAQLAIDFTRRPSRNRVAYYNTTHLTGDSLDEATRNARKQDVLVLSIFRGAGRPLSASEVWKAGAEAGSDWLLTSVRRSINTLTREHQLRKTDEHREGPYGRPERLWVAWEEAAGASQGTSGSAGE